MLGIGFGALYMMTLKPEQLHPTLFVFGLFATLLLYVDWVVNTARNRHNFDYRYLWLVLCCINADFCVQMLIFSGVFSLEPRLAAVICTFFFEKR